MAKRTVQVLICDEPAGGNRGMEPCGRPAVQMVTMVLGPTTTLEKDLCQHHLTRYTANARRKLNGGRRRPKIVAKRRQRRG